MTLTHLDLDRIEGLAGIKLLRGPLSKRATSAEFNEWQAREVVDVIDAMITRIRELEGALEPFANLELPKHRPEGTTGFYSIRFSAIEAVRPALQRKTS